jgi:DNA-binding MarR family transcriptional regulator
MLASKQLLRRARPARTARTAQPRALPYRKTPTPHPTPSSPSLDIDTADRLRVVIGRLHRRLRATPAATAAGLTPTKSSVLHTVIRTGPVGLTDLAELEGLNPTLLSRTVGALADAGLLDRISDPVDRRAALVSATARGRRLADKLRRERTAALNQALAPLTETDRQALERALPALEALADELKR